MDRTPIKPGQSARPIELVLPPALLNTRTHGSSCGKERSHRTDSRSAAMYYEQATGEAPGEVMELDEAVLIETSVAGDYEVFPNGYVPILIVGTPQGWLVCDTGQSPPAAEIETESVQRHGSVFYLSTSSSMLDLQRAIRKMVTLLRRLH